MTGAAPVATPAGARRASGLPAGATRPSDALTAFLAAGVAWLVAGALTGAGYALGGPFELRWLALHFAFVGGVSQLVVGAAQFFACAFLATAPLGRRTVRAELVLWNLATAGIAIGVTADVPALAGIGGALVLAGLAVFDGALRAMRRRSLQRAPWATRWYRTAALLFACGALLGPVMAGDAVWTHGSLLGAHLALNLGGWFGTAIVGTLHTFYPSLTGTRLRIPRLQAPTHAAWTAGIAAVAVASAFAVDGLAVAGWTLLAAAAAMLGANLLASAAGAARVTPPLLIVSAGQILLGAAIVAGLSATLAHGPLAALLGPQRDTLVLTLLAGWVGLTVAGSLLHLLRVMVRVRRMPAPAPPGDRDPLAYAGAALVLAGIGVLALGPDGAGAPGRVVLAAGYALLLARVAALAVAAVRAAPLGLRGARS